MLTPGGTSGLDLCETQTPVAPSARNGFYYINRSFGVYSSEAISTVPFILDIVIAIGCLPLFSVVPCTPPHSRFFKSKSDHDHRPTSYKSGADPGVCNTGGGGGR